MCVGVKWFISSYINIWMRCRDVELFNPHYVLVVYVFNNANLATLKISWNTKYRKSMSYFISWCVVLFLHRVSFHKSLSISSHERLMCVAFYQKVLLRLIFFFLFYSVMSKMPGAMSHYRNRWLKLKQAEEHKSFPL